MHWLFAAQCEILAVNQYKFFTIMYPCYMLLTDKAKHGGVVNTIRDDGSHPSVISSKGANDSDGRERHDHQGPK